MHSFSVRGILRRYWEPLLWSICVGVLVYFAVRLEDENLTLLALLLSAPAGIITVESLLRALEERVEVAIGSVEVNGNRITFKGVGQERHIEMSELVEITALPTSPTRLLLTLRDAPGLEIGLSGANTERLAEGLGRLPGFSAKDVFTLAENSLTTEVIVWERVLG